MIQKVIVSHLFPGSLNIPCYEIVLGVRDTSATTVIVLSVFHSCQHSAIILGVSGLFLSQEIDYCDCFVVVSGLRGDSLILSCMCWNLTFSFWELGAF